MKESEREFHEVANLFPMMNEEEFANLVDDISENGQLEPIWLHEDGRIIDGRNRYKACCELGLMPNYRTWRGEGSATSFVLSLNLHRRHLTAGQKAALAYEVRPMFEEEARVNMSKGGEKRKGNQYTELEGFQNFGNLPIETAPIHADKEAAKATGANHAYVSDYARIVETSPDVAEAVKAGRVNIPTAKKLAELDEETQAQVMEQNERITAAAIKPHVAHNSGNNEWYTPTRFIDSAYAVMGGIDTDPASCEFANASVKASDFYTVDNDGLSKEWRGRVWMNPPYSAGLVSKFIEKLRGEVESGNTTEFIVLVNNATETAWFQNLASMSSMICFPKSRIKYISPDGEKNSPLQGQAFLYFGENADGFGREFEVHGFVCGVL